MKGKLVFKKNEGTTRTSATDLLYKEQPIDEMVFTHSSVNISKVMSEHGEFSPSAHTVGQS